MIHNEVDSVCCHTDGVVTVCRQISDDEKKLNLRERQHDYHHEETDERVPTFFTEQSSVGVR